MNLPPSPPPLPPDQLRDRRAKRLLWSITVLAALLLIGASGGPGGFGQNPNITFWVGVALLHAEIACLIISRVRGVWRYYLGGVLLASMLIGTYLVTYLLPEQNQLNAKQFLSEDIAQRRKFISLRVVIRMD